MGVDKSIGPFESVGCAFETHRGCFSCSSILNYKSQWNPRTTGSHKRGIFYMMRMRKFIRRYRISENHPWHIPLQEDFISFTCMIFALNLQVCCELRARSLLPGLKHPACAGYGSHATRQLRDLSSNVLRSRDWLILPPSMPELPILVE